MPVQQMLEQVCQKSVRAWLRRTASLKIDCHEETFSRSPVKDGRVNDSDVLVIGAGFGNAAALECALKAIR